MSQLKQLIKDGPFLNADGFEDALIGFVWPKTTGLNRAVYCVESMVKICQDRDGMTEENAREYVNFNVIGAYMWPQTPCYLELEP